MGVDLHNRHRRTAFQRPDRQRRDGIVAAQHDRNRAALADLPDRGNGVAGIAVDIAHIGDHISAIHEAQSEIGKGAAVIEVVVVEHAAEAERPFADRARRIGRAVMDLTHAIGHAERHADHGEIGGQRRQIADQRRAKKGCVRCFGRLDQHLQHFPEKWSPVSAKMRHIR